MVALNGTAPEHAERAAKEWRAAVHAQRRASVDHSEFYTLTADLVDTLHSLGSLAMVLVRQVDSYDDGRTLYDDSGTITARERLTLAVEDLRDLASALEIASRRAGQFHSDIGHIGGAPDGSGDLR